MCPCRSFDFFRILSMLAFFDEKPLLCEFPKSDEYGKFREETYLRKSDANQRAVFIVEVVGFGQRVDSQKMLQHNAIYRNNFIGQICRSWTTTGL